MHTIHTTHGFVVSSKPYGEAGKILAIFTKNLGLIYATAQGIRLEKSKLRYFTQDHSFGIYSLVNGREYWRVINADSIPILSDSGSGASPKIKEFLARIALLLRRLLPGEDAHPELFDQVFECMRFFGCGSAEIIDDDMMMTLESLIVTRMLCSLGYIGDIIGMDREVKSADISIDLLLKLKVHRSSMNQHINKALKESML